MFDPAHRGLEELNAMASSPQPTRECAGGYRPQAQGLSSVLIVNKDLPRFPGGIAIEYLNTVGLAARGISVGLVSMVHSVADRQAARNLRERQIELYLWENPGLEAGASKAGPGRLVQRIHRSWQRVAVRVRAGLQRTPTEVAWADLEFRNLADPILKALEQRHWDLLIVVQTSQARSIDYLPKFPAAALVVHDIRSLLFGRRADAQRHLRRRWRREARRYFRFERDYSQKFDVLVAVSEHDAAWMRKHYGASHVVALPLPLDADYFRPGSNELERGNVILFTGLMNHPPNVDAALFFAQEVFPEIRKTVPEAEFWVVGRDPSPEVQALAALDGVKVTGAVPDTRPYFAAASVVVVPLRFASGARYKILEAWAMNKCVVATRLGAEGLEAQHGRNIYFADDAVSMANTIVRLLREPELRSSVSKAGRHIVVTRHSWQEVAATYHQQLDAALQRVGRSSPPMRVCFDLRWMVPGLAGGVENLARSFLQELIKLDGWNRYTLLVPARCLYDFDVRSRPNFRLMSTDSLSAVADGWLWAVRRWWHKTLRLDYWESPAVRRLRFLKNLEADLVYSFTGYIFPDVVPLRHVVQIPDIQHEFYPQFFSASALEERRRLFAAAVRCAEHICTISEFSRKTIIEKLSVPPEKITAIPLAAEPIFQPQPRPEDSDVLRRYHLESNGFLLFPGHTWWHKNHKTAIAALKVLKSKHGVALPLVCTGGPREAHGSLCRQIDEEGLQSQVLFLGYCPREDMPALYRHAACLVFPSLFEGFGMPVLEAMASGCPVVCSNTTSLPEVAGDAALLVAPQDPEGLADAIRLVLVEGKLRDELRQRGLARARLFSWRRFTLETLAVLYAVHRGAYRIPKPETGSGK